MICLKKDKKWIVDLKNENNTLPGGFRIGHGSQSKTRYPAIFTPIGENYSYVDNPGFSETRGVGIEISNSFFREEVTKHVENLKFLILLTHAGIVDARGDPIRDTITSFSKLLGIFEDKDTKYLSKSIGIIVTRVDNEGDTDSEMKSYFKKKILERLETEYRF